MDGDGVQGGIDRDRWWEALDEAFVRSAPAQEAAAADRVVAPRPMAPSAATAAPWSLAPFAPTAPPWSRPPSWTAPPAHAPGPTPRPGAWTPRPVSQPPRRRSPGRTVFGVVLLLALAIGAELAERSAPQTGRPGAAPPDQVVVVYASPVDVPPSAELAAAVQQEAAAALGWIGAQVGRPLRVVEDGAGRPLVRTVALSASLADLQARPDLTYPRVLADVRAAAPDPRAMYLVLADVSTEVRGALGTTCGEGGPQAAMVYLRSCPGLPPSAGSVWGSRTSVTVAHEVVHALGAVAPCAPHADAASGHVVDDPRDLMYVGADGASLLLAADDYVLDAGRDDYLDHPDGGCPDIVDSPLWWSPQRRPPRGGQNSV